VEGIRCGAQWMIGVLLSLFTGPMWAWVSENFEPNVRLTSATLGYNLGVCFFPALATALVNGYGSFFRNNVWIRGLLTAPSSQSTFCHNCLSGTILYASVGLYASVKVGKRRYPQEMITMEEAGALNCRDLFFFCHSLVMTFSVSSDGRGGVIGYYLTKQRTTLRR
jgi:hypothetical protein